MEIAPGVHSLGDKSGGWVRALLIDDDEGLTLIDTLYASDRRLVLEELRRLGRKPSDIKNIILTHAHQSHIRGLAALRGASGARVYAHEFEADVLAGRRQYEIPPGLGHWPRRPLRLYPYQFGLVCGSRCRRRSKSIRDCGTAIAWARSPYCTHQGTRREA